MRFMCLLEGGRFSEDRVFTEKDWSLEKESTIYEKSKRRAEKAAWELVKNLPGITYRKFEIKPRGLYFSKALFEGLTVYLWREICVSKSIGLALQLRVNLPFLLCFTLYLYSKYKPSGGLYLEGRFNGRFFALPV